MLMVGADAYMAWMGVRSVVPSEPRMCSESYRGVGLAIFSCTIWCPAMRMPCDPAPGWCGTHEHAVDAHHEQQAGDPPRLDEPLLAIDDPLIAVSFGTGLE
jgi:hypothetical protein